MQIGRPSQGHQRVNRPPRAGEGIAHGVAWIHVVSRPVRPRDFSGLSGLETSPACQARDFSGLAGLETSPARETREFGGVPASREGIWG